jgi:hypothetical protein
MADAYVCPVKRHWKDGLFKSYNSSIEGIYLIGSSWFLSM